jgi:hypothetical protein
MEVMQVTPMRCATQLALLAGIAWLTAGPSAQGLGEVARKEAARRQQVAAGKKYTNEDLPAADTPTVTAAVPAAPAAPPEAAPVPGEKADKAAAGEKAAGTGEPAITPPREKRDEKYWRDRSGVLRVKLNEGQERVKSLQQRLAELEAALARGAGSSHTQERTVTLQALTEAQENHAHMKAEWTRMEDRARAANVPSEWLR